MVFFDIFRTTLTLFLLFNLGFAIEVNICNCEKPKIEGLLDFDDYANCNIGSQARKQIQVKYTLFTSKPATMKFRGYLCTEWVKTQSIEIFFFGSRISQLQTTPIDVTAEACWRKHTDRRCNGNIMSRTEDKWIFEQEPAGEGRWMAKTDYTTTNCIFEEIVLEKACADCPIISPIGPLRNHTETGYFQHNHVTVVWKDEIELHHKPCEVRKIETSTGTLFLATPEEQARIKDDKHQLDFFFAKPSEYPRNAKDIFKILEMEQTFLSYSVINTTATRKFPLPRFKDSATAEDFYVDD